MLWTMRRSQPRSSHRVPATGESAHKERKAGTRAYPDRRGCLTFKVFKWFPENDELGLARLEKLPRVIISGSAGQGGKVLSGMATRFAAKRLKCLIGSGKR